MLFDLRPDLDKRLVHGHGVSGPERMPATISPGTSRIVAESRSQKYQRVVPGLLRELAFLLV